MLRSFFHKSSTVAKAVEEAWVSSGCPEVFTIKVVEQGKAGFLWFSKQPAIISFTYTFEQKNSNKTHKNSSSESSTKEKHTLSTAEKTVHVKKEHVPSVVASKVAVHPKQIHAKPVVKEKEPIVIKRRELKPKPESSLEIKPEESRIAFKEQLIEKKHLSTVHKNIKHKPELVESNDSLGFDEDNSSDKNLKTVDFQPIRDFFKGFLEIVSGSDYSSIDCSINDKNIEIRVYGLEKSFVEEFFNSQSNKALCLVISAVLKRNFGRKFQKYRIVILFE